MILDGRSVLLIDEDEESILLARRTMRGVAVCGYADGMRMMSEGNVRENVLINADGFALTALDIALQTTLLDGVVRIFVLSAENAIPIAITGRLFVINGRLVFFSNGRNENGFLFEKENQGEKSCGLCEGTGELIVGDERDVCPRCDTVNLKKGKAWHKFYHFLAIQEPPAVITMAFPPPLFSS